MNHIIINVFNLVYVSVLTNYNIKSVSLNFQNALKEQFLEYKHEKFIPAGIFCWGSRTKTTAFVFGRVMEVDKKKQNSSWKRSLTKNVVVGDYESIKYKNIF